MQWWKKKASTRREQRPQAPPVGATPDDKDILEWQRKAHQDWPAMIPSPWASNLWESQVVWNQIAGERILALERSNSEMVRDLGVRIRGLVDVEDIGKTHEQPICPLCNTVIIKGAATAEVDTPDGTKLAHYPCSKGDFLR